MFGFLGFLHGFVCKELQVYQMHFLKMFLCVRNKSDVFPPDFYGKPTMNEDVSPIKHEVIFQPVIHVSFLRGNDPLC